MEANTTSSRLGGFFRYEFVASDDADGAKESDDGMIARRVGMVIDRRML